MLTGRLRVLSAADPDPYPDSIRVDLDELPDDDGEDSVIIGKAGRTRKGKTAIQKAVEKKMR